MTADSPTAPEIDALKKSVPLEQRRAIAAFLRARALRIRQSLKDRFPPLPDGAQRVTDELESDQ